MLISYSTYQELGFNKLEQDAFNQEIINATILIESITQNFYVEHGFHDLNADLKSEIPFIVQRATLYEKALCIQCDFQADYGSTIEEQNKNNQINSVSIGKASVNYGKNTNIPLTKGNSGVCISAYRVLYPTGLLFCGVDAQ